MSALKTTNTALIERLLNDIGGQLITKYVQTHDTANIARRFGGIKKTLDILTFDNAKKMIRGWKKDGSSLGEEFNYDKVRLSVAKFMIVLDVTPMEDQIEAFDAELDAQNVIKESINDQVYAVQFFQWLLGKTLAYMDAELEDADWKAINVTGAADDDFLINKFDGFRRQAATLAAAGKGTVVNTGVIDATNAVAKVELFYGGFDKQLKRRGAIIACSFNTFDNYKVNWRTINQGRELGVTQFEGTKYQSISIYLGGGLVTLVTFQGIGDDDVLIGFPQESLAIGYEMLGDWNVQMRSFTVYGYLALKYGVTFLYQYPGYLVVNDRLIATEITTPRTNS